MWALIAIPGVSVFGSQPCRAKPVGPFISIAHCTAWPCSSLTFNTIQAWGFVHWNSLTVPSSWTILRASNMANEWCALAGIAQAATAAIPATASVLYDIERLQRFLVALQKYPPGMTTADRAASTTIQGVTTGANLQ